MIEMHDKSESERRWLLIMEAEGRTELSECLRRGILEAARRRDRVVEVAELRKEEVPPCSGCFHCITRHPGTCVSDGAFRAVTEMTPGCEKVFFLTPVRFGSFSSTVKNVIDRGGLIITCHQSCTQVIVGYGEDVTDEERSTFMDITALHRGAADVVHPRSNESFEVFFAGTPGDTDEILRRL
jgi:multimeric flavodoxin WrbA